MPVPRRPEFRPPTRARCGYGTLKVLGAVALTVAVVVALYTVLLPLQMRFYLARVSAHTGLEIDFVGCKYLIFSDDVRLDQVKIRGPLGRLDVDLEAASVEIDTNRPLALISSSAYLGEVQMMDVQGRVRLRPAGDPPPTLQFDLFEVQGGEVEVILEDLPVPDPPEGAPRTVTVSHTLTLPYLTVDDLDTARPVESFLNRARLRHYLFPSEGGNQLDGSWISKRYTRPMTEKELAERAADEAEEARERAARGEDDDEDEGPPRKPQADDDWAIAHHLPQREGGLFLLKSFSPLRLRPYVTGALAQLQNKRMHFDIFWKDPPPGASHLTMHVRLWLSAAQWGDDGGPAQDAIAGFFRAVSIGIIQLPNAGVFVDFEMQLPLDRLHTATTLGEAGFWRAFSEAADPALRAAGLVPEPTATESDGAGREGAPPSP